MYVAIRRAISGLAEARLQFHKGPTMTLSSLLPFARSKCTTDPRDKIFAFTNLLPAVPASLQVDYGEETKTTFKKVAQLMLSEDVGLRLLAECESNTNSDLEGLAACLPWVPNWAQSRICEPLPGGLSPSLKGHEFCAGSLLEAVNFEILDDTLVLEALIWDEVIFVDPLASVTGSSPRISVPLLAHLGIERDPSSRRIPPVSLSNVPCDNFGDFANLCRLVEVCNRDPRGFKVLDPESLWGGAYMGDEYHRNIVGRSLVLTSEHYVGWALPATALGDIISIVPGCHVPIVLRKIHDHNPNGEGSPPPLDTGRIQKESRGERLPSFRVIGEACKYPSCLTCGTQF
jgi:hypothetical protein